MFKKYITIPINKQSKQIAQQHGVCQDDNYISFVAGTYTDNPTLAILKVFYFQ